MQPVGAPAGLLYTTARLWVRALTIADVDDLYAVYGDPVGARWVDDGQPIAYADCRLWIRVTERNYATRGYGMSALISRDDHRVVGFCGLVHPGGQPEAELKYALRRTHWGLGLATEAARGMLDYGREAFGLTRVIATIAPQNVASARVLTKLGMAHITDRPEPDGSRTAVYAVTLES